MEKDGPLFALPITPGAPTPLTATAPGEGLKELKLRNLRLKNFKGIRWYELVTDGESVGVFGDNATGKTSLFDAYDWLLFDKDSGGRKDFDIKTLDKNGVPTHGLEHEVEGVFSLDGRGLTLRKRYSEIWTKRQGGAEKIFSGHSTEHSVDGVPVTKREYDARIAGIADEEVFKLLSDPGYFSERMHWQERRKLLLAVCGDVSDAQIIASDPTLAPLTEILGERSLEDHRKVLAASRSGLNKQLGQIPVRISEVQSGLPKAVALSPTEADAVLVQSREDLRLKYAELATLEAGGEGAKVQKRLGEIESALLGLENASQRTAATALNGLRVAKADAEDDVASAERNLHNIQATLLLTEGRVELADAELVVLRVQFRGVSGEVFAHTDDADCPVCGQALPEHMLAGARARALERFNIDRARRLDNIGAEGKLVGARKDAADAEVLPLLEKRTALGEALVGLRTRAELARQTLKSRETMPSLVSVDPTYRELQAERDAILAASEAAPADPDTQPLMAEIVDLEASIASVEQGVAQVALRASGLARIQELKDEERRLAAEYERTEREQYLTEEFTRVQVGLLTEKINSRFALARFKLFAEQVNGALAPCCETTVDGVPYGTALNRGARMNVGLDIIDTLADHYGFAPPVWIDNREAITRLRPVKTQVICLIVNEQDKTLRVDKEVA